MKCPICHQNLSKYHTNNGHVLYECWYCLIAWVEEEGKLLQVD